MLLTVAYVLTGLVGAGIFVIGLNGLRTPRAAAGFGIPDTPTDDPAFRSWLRVKAVRDVAAGVFTFILMAGATPHLLGWFILAATGIPVGDALIVLRSNGPKAIAYGVHAATAAVMLVATAILLIG
ncbi:DUF4267 domain-containing protein [Actinoplanes sichuanensis]|uniref:DUF4267 domain-containing protein n=1 Tax=Actinoplanes sichuanensis TaxID=512349 RepID=A0ABW4AAT4_9ACTN|nr:DUF4267 domain-containing protein [Actinoplanes sichuanensis]BEL05391.1 DUF4267 domain-containing protein [Actinoplanes sichuanensis]